MIIKSYIFMAMSISFSAVLFVIPSFSLQFPIHSTWLLSLSQNLSVKPSRVVILSVGPLLLFEEFTISVCCPLDRLPAYRKCENYRGITFLPTAYKLFANIITNRLNEHLEDEMVEEQYGLKKGRSCTDAIFTVLQIIEKRKERNLPRFLLFIDYEKAYDNVNRQSLEMMDNKSPNYLLNTIKCIFGNTKVRIKFNDGISEPIYINKGLSQGCGLSPVKFNIYINKIIQEFKIVIKNGIQLNNRKLVNTILYTDGQILMATSEDEWQIMAYHLKLIARKYKMIISSIKTKSMAMCGNQIQRIKIAINENTIEHKTF